VRPNRLRQLIAEGRPSIGTHVHSTWPNVVEMIGHTRRFDYVEFSGEYAPYDLHGLDNFCRAAELVGLGAMIKLDQQPRTWLAQRAIGAGFQAVLFADIRTADDARECVRAVRPDTPHGQGTYGAADRRNSYWGQAASADYIRALKEIVVVLMIEKRSAVDNLDEILAVPGIDMIQWGPADYAMSIGRPGGWYDDDVRQVEREVLAKCLAAGIPARAEITDPADASYYLEQGVRDFCIGTDINILYTWLEARGGELAGIIGADRSDAPSPPGPPAGPPTELSRRD
jgi:2-keto-3-deoxy-L-rhamnonate aldolase RhmA